jgi:hypothetical protein
LEEKAIAIRHTSVTYEQVAHRSAEISSDANPTLTPRTRRRLARLIVDQG